MRKSIAEEADGEAEDEAESEVAIEETLDDKAEVEQLLKGLKLKLKLSRVGVQLMLLVSEGNTADQVDFQIPRLIIYTL